MENIIWLGAFDEMDSVENLIAYQNKNKGR